ncbi:hypothetical protein BS47DRAFT_1395568 [Hydnum rufescens UP504]|uniref:Uncharacterized protein n=1 Tax=Hydnum rufescens UP504 TaxID=1448309 RepID=A0A9P6ASJ8_9AGAM|nr:hypothetical protein BS47DRAFT_1395568 [Hydnum rufescens UP504]
MHGSDTDASDSGGDPHFCSRYKRAGQKYENICVASCPIRSSSLVIWRSHTCSAPLGPLVHPFAKARERVRTLNAVKIEQMFTRPFLASLEGHVDGVNAVVRKPHSLAVVATASADGEIIIHDLPQRKHLLRLPTAHKRSVTGVCFADSDRLLSCGVDQTVKMWDVRTSLDQDGSGDFGEDSLPQMRKPLTVFQAETAFKYGSSPIVTIILSLTLHTFSAIDHHRANPLFATASNCVHIWDETKSSPIMNLNFPTSTETITALKFNLSETSVLASTGSDRIFTLYDVRTGKANEVYLSSKKSRSSPVTAL